jgi:hypothetical protein
MLIWIFLLIIFAAGAIGGSVNAFLTDNGFMMPKKVENDRGNKIYQPGCLGNMSIGGIAACVSWGLYGPFANAYIIIGESSEPSTSQPPGITVAALVGAVLVGIGGARWLTNEVDKTLLRVAATEAASGKENEQLARELSTASPAAALKKAAQANESPHLRSDS